MLRNCREMTKLISESLERKLTWRERLELWFHASMCGMCKVFRKNAMTLRRMMQTLNAQSLQSQELSAKDANESTTTETLSPSAKVQILKAVKKIEQPNADDEYNSD